MLLSCLEIEVGKDACSVDARVLWGKFSIPPKKRSLADVKYRNLKYHDIVSGLTKRDRKGSSFIRYWYRTGTALTPGFGDTEMIDDSLN
jgi:hypothetical protein